jgi:hypothetical protein
MVTDYDAFLTVFFVVVVLFRIFYVVFIYPQVPSIQNVQMTWQHILTHRHVIKCIFLNNFTIGCEPVQVHTECLLGSLTLGPPVIILNLEFTLLLFCFGSATSVSHVFLFLGLLPHLVEPSL